MARRIDIELTTARDDGTWTWRAAGARQPKGTLDGSLLYAGAKAGDVVRADAEFEVDGITVVAVLPPRQRREDPERIEIISRAAEEPAVRLISAGGQRRSHRDDEDRRASRPRRDAGSGGHADREGRPGERRGPRSPREPSSDARPGRSASRPRGERATRPQSSGRPERRDHEPHAPREGHAPPTRGFRADRPAPTAPPPKPKPKRLQPQRTHRDAALAQLPTEHRPVAEQVLRGGIPAVRKAIDEQVAKAGEETRPAANVDALIALAEELLPRLRLAEFLDRAEAATRDADEISIRDLRSVVTAGEAVTRDEQARSLVNGLKAALERRLTAQREEWTAEIVRCLDEARIVRALRISGRPPEPGTRLPQELAGRLTEQTASAMSPEATPDRWSTLLDAAASSPVRRTVKPAGLPAEPPDELVAAARKAASSMPGVAALLGIEPPPLRRAPRPPASPSSAPHAGPTPAIGARRAAPIGAPRPPAPKPPGPGGSEKASAAEATATENSVGIPSAEDPTPTAEASGDNPPIPEPDDQVVVPGDPVGGGEAPVEVGEQASIEGMA